MRNAWIKAKGLALIGLLAFALTGVGCSPETQDGDSLQSNPSQPSMIQNSLQTKKYFDSYILKAVSQVYANYKLLGYDINSMYTHPIQYGPHGTIKDKEGPKTMCVAAMLEIIVTAMQIYAQETSDVSPFQFLPITSFNKLTINDIKGHIWVNSKFDSYGTADALVNFGMGERVPFENLKPGGFINFNRTRRTGHGVVFISFIDKEGREYTTHNPSVIGFKYFSAQGMRDPDGGGFDYRYGVFSEHDCPELPYKRDCGIIYSKNRKMFNVGRMLAPANWNRVQRPAFAMPEVFGETVLDGEYFDGLTTDDL